MRSTTATGRVLALGLMVVFSLALAGQSAWGAETSTKERPDKQGTCSYNRIPGAVSLAKAEVEGAGARKERLRDGRKPRGDQVARGYACAQCLYKCDSAEEGCVAGCASKLPIIKGICKNKCDKTHQLCVNECWEELGASDCDK